MCMHMHMHMLHMHMHMHMSHVSLVKYAALVFSFSLMQYFKNHRALRLLTASDGSGTLQPP